MKKNENTGRSENKNISIRIPALLVALALTVCSLTACGSATGVTNLVKNAANTEAVTDATELIITDETESTEAAEQTEAAETETESEMESETASEPEANSENTTETEDESTEEDPDTLEGYTFTSLSKTMYVKKSVNVRSLPSTDGEKLGSLNKSDSVAVTGQCNETGWYRIIYNGKVGYCSNNYLSSTKPSSGSSSGNSGNSSSGSGSSGSSSSGSSGSGSTIKTGYTQAELQAMAEEVIELVNEEREAAGLDPLEENSDLMDAAAVRAEEQKQTFGHTRPDGSSWSTIFDDLNITSCLCGGENAAYGQNSAEMVMECWMNSSGHKANILGSGYDYIGVGVYYSSGTFYWIQIFGYEDPEVAYAILEAEHDKNGTHKWIAYGGTWSTDGYLVSGDDITYLCYDCCKDTDSPEGGTIIWYDPSYIEGSSEYAGGYYEYGTGKCMSAGIDLSTAEGYSELFKLWPE